AEHQASGEARRVRTPRGARTPGHPDACFFALRQYELSGSEKITRGPPAPGWDDRCAYPPSPERTGEHGGYLGSILMLFGSNLTISYWPSLAAVAKTPV